MSGGSDHKTERPRHLQVEKAHLEENTRNFPGMHPNSTKRYRSHNKSAQITRHQRNSEWNYNHSTHLRKAKKMKMLRMLANIKTLPN